LKKTPAVVRLSAKLAYRTASDIKIETPAAFFEPLKASFIAFAIQYA